MRLQHMLDLIYSQLQIRNIVEFHFGAGLQFLIASNLKQVLKVKFQFVLKFKCQVGF